MFRRSEFHLMSRPAQPRPGASGQRCVTGRRHVQLRLPLSVEQKVVDLTEHQTQQVEELARRHLEYHDRVVDQRVRDFFDDLDRQKDRINATADEAARWPSADAPRGRGRG